MDFKKYLEQNELTEIIIDKRRSLASRTKTISSRLHNINTFNLSYI